MAGEAHPPIGQYGRWRPRFTLEIALKIRAELAGGAATVRGLARQYGVQPSHIRLIRDARIWKI